MRTPVFHEKRGAIRGLWPVAALALTALAMGGCESASDMAETVRTKILSPREEPRSRTFAAPQRATYEAALQAAKELDYTFQNGGPAEGRLEELSPIESSGPGSYGGSRQLSLKARMEPTPDGGTEVTVAFTEILEPDATKAGQATETPLRDTPLYEVFFRSIQQHLSGTPKP